MHGFGFNEWNMFHWYGIDELPTFIQCCRTNEKIRHEKSIAAHIGFIQATYLEMNKRKSPAFSFTESGQPVHLYHNFSVYAVIATAPISVMIISVASPDLLIKDFRSRGSSFLWPRLDTTLHSSPPKICSLWVNLGTFCCDSFVLWHLPVTKISNYENYLVASTWIQLIDV